MKSWRKREGKLIHDGDCLWWHKTICNCGLLHHLVNDKTPGWAYKEMGLMYIAIESYDYGLSRFERNCVRLIKFVDSFFSKIGCFIFSHRKINLIKDLKVCVRCKTVFEVKECQED